VEVCAVELPGRRTRFKEPVVTAIAEAVERVVGALSLMAPLPTVLFGHSMGALFAFELARAWWPRQCGTLELLVVSGCRAPHVARERRIHDLPRDEFLDALKVMGGTPDELLRNDGLMQLVEPMLRADLRLVETHVTSAQRPLEVPIRAIGGRNDPTVSREALSAWARYSTRDFAVEQLPGDHFFIHGSRSMLLQSLSGHLETVRARARAAEPAAGLQAST
jgi:medium-chain acyl-[acyl-carrier-protein] hydrolase